MKQVASQFRIVPIALGIATMSLGSAAVCAADNSGIEEVVITARKTEESVQVVPVSVMALSASDLQKSAVLDVQDLRSSVPGLYITANSQGGAPVFAIRAAKADNGTSDTVTAYIGDMPVASTISIANMMYDMQSVSVLKGPQGTLFGANSTGGAIIFRPNTPTDKFEGYADVGIGNYSRQTFQGMVNIPVNDVFQVRIAGETVSRDGFVKNHGTDVSEFSDDKHESLRISARLKPSADWEHNLMLDYLNVDDKPYQAIPVAFRSRYLFAGVPVDYAKVPGLITNDTANVNAGGSALFNKAKIWNGIYTLDYNISDQASFKNVLGYQDIKLDAFEDNDGTPFKGVQSRTAQNIQMWTLEPSIDLKSEDGRLRNKTGLFISNKKWTVGGGSTVLNLPFDLVGATPVQIGTAAVLPRQTHSFYDREFKSHAVYTQFSYDLSKELTATLGLRYTWDRANYGIQYKTDAGAAIVANRIGSGQAFSATGVCASTLPFYDGYNATACKAYSSLKSQAPSFTFTLEDKYAENSMIYATLRGGYLVGGFNNNINPVASGFPIVFKPEKVVDFETGLKSDWSLWGRPIRTNLAVFYINYKDQQRVNNGTINGATFVAVANAGSSNAYGLDLDVTYEVTENLELSASWNHLESEYTKFNGIINVPGKYTYVDLGGTPMAQAPKDQVNLSATAKWPLATDVGKVSSTLSWFWTDKTLHHDSPTYNCTTNPPTGGQCVTIDPTQDFSAYDVLPAFDLWNFTTSWKGIMGSNFDANFWIKNLTDKKYKTYGSNQMLQFGYATYVFGHPREIGLNVRYNF
jgi:iron complex outermembrane receptor protein